jgi:amino acid adenylation domain-containing protein
MIPTLDRAALLALGTGIRTASDRDLTIVSCFEQRAAETPDAIAVVSDRLTLTYAELDRRSTQLARFLRARGVREQSCIGVQIERSALLPVALLAILKAGAAFVPIDHAVPRDQLAHMIADAAIRLVVVAGDPHARCDQGYIVVDLLAEAKAVDAEDPTPLAIPSAATALASIMYTSGSSGRPKGVLISHRAIVALVRGTDMLDIACDDVFLQFAPPAFDASTFEIWSPLLNGATLAIAPPGALSLGELGHTIERYGVTTLWLTAPLFALMVETELARFTGLRSLLTGGDVVSPEHARRFVTAAPACRLIDGYGPTENTTFSCTYTIGSAAEIGASLPIGRPIANSCAYVLDADLEPVAPGTVGELYVGGDGLADGYLNLPDLTAERFVKNPFAQDGSRLYRTGDRARMEPTGVLAFCGRIDQQVKIRGYRVELDEVESAIALHPMVLHAVAIVEDREQGKILHAFVVPVPGAQLDVADVRAFLAGTVSASMLPHRIAIRTTLPQFASGKIDRMALVREVNGQATAPVLRLVPTISRSTTTLEQIANLWCRTLGVSEVPNDVNFFDAGGDSLRLLSLHTALRAAFEVDIPLTDLFRECTIRKQRAYIAGLRS